jgi:DeoR family ulaG and ulaABCDEF operon transcriptional repressor
MMEKQRHKILIDLLAEKGFASVPILSKELNASEATIRRDLNKLDQSKQLLKIRGGAESLQPATTSNHRKHLQGTVFLAESDQRQRRKSLIAAKAVSLCEDNESIIINGGSSTYMMKDALAKRQLNILTNSFALAGVLSENSNNQITLPGGELYAKQSLIVSSFDNDSIPNYHGTKMFMGTPGIGKFGVMETDPLLIRSEQKLRKQADKLIILADSTKIGKRSSFIFCPLEDVDILITDSDIKPESVRHFEDSGIEVIVVDLS